MATIINFADLQKKQSTSRAEQQAISNMSINQLAESMQRIFEAIEENPTVAGQPEPCEISETVLKNLYCMIELQSDKEVFGRNLKDSYNEPAFYNKTFRGLKKGMEGIDRPIRRINNNEMQCR